VVPYAKNGRLNKGLQNVFPCFVTKLTTVRIFSKLCTKYWNFAKVFVNFWPDSPGASFTVFSDDLLFQETNPETHGFINSLILSSNTSGNNELWFQLFEVNVGLFVWCRSAQPSIKIDAAVHMIM